MCGLKLGVDGVAQGGVRLVMLSFSMSATNRLPNNLVTCFDELLWGDVAFPRKKTFGMYSWEYRQATSIIKAGERTFL
jgi:hypothetical protein